MGLKAKVRARMVGFFSCWGLLSAKARFVLKVHVCAVAAALVAATLVTNLGAHQGFKRVPLAVPYTAALHGPWHSEVAAFGRKISGAFGVPSSTAQEFAGWILEASERQGLDPDLLASLVLTESSFRKDVTSAVGAIGPAQVRPEYWSEFCGISNLGDPAENIYCGAQVLSHMVDRCGGEGCALGAYNIGFHSERRQAAQRYVTKVGRYRQHLRNFPL